MNGWEKILLQPDQEQLLGEAMRMSQSFLDNTRQLGVYDELEKATNGDENRIRRAILARLRLDDLLINDSLGGETRLVWSITDTLDGKLFSIVSPKELTGIDFEIYCHPRIASAHVNDVVPMQLRSWLHDEDGVGRAGGFLALGAKQNLLAAQALSNQTGLDVNTLEDARDVLVGVGTPSAELDRLIRLWEDWDTAIKQNKVRLKPWSAEASGVPMLQHFQETRAKSGELSEFALTEVGTEIFQRALDLLAEASGRRDKAIMFLLKKIEELEDNDKSQAVEVYGLFTHYTFSAIARANQAEPEFSASIGNSDCVLSAEQLDEIEAISNNRHPVEIDPNVVCGLGDLDGSDYEKIKSASRSRVRAGIEEYVKHNRRGGEKLKNALDFLAKEIGTTTTHTTGGNFRTLSIEGYAGAMSASGGVALDLFFGLGQPITSGAVTGVTGAAAATAATKYLENSDFILLRKSLVRTFEEELENRISRSQRSKASGKS